jgi:hypothetical protein
VDIVTTAGRRTVSTTNSAASTLTIGRIGNNTYLNINTGITLTVGGAAPSPRPTPTA